MTSRAIAELEQVTPEWLTAVLRRNGVLETGWVTAVLRRYYQGLLAHGVTSYSYNDLLTDYWLMITYMLFDSIWDQTAGSSESYWRPKLECLTRAYLDWECTEFYQLASNY